MIITIPLLIITIIRRYFVYNEPVIHRIHLKVLQKLMSRHKKETSELFCCALSRGDNISIMYNITVF